MKRFFLISLFLFFLLLISCSSELVSFDYDSANVVVGDKTLVVEVADSVDKQAQGLMFRKRLGNDKGMLFVYNESKEKFFWMKNTFIPLDIVFINESFNIVMIQEGVPCEDDDCVIYSSVKPAKYVLEVNGGFCEDNNVRIGDFVKIVFD